MAKFMWVNFSCPYVSTFSCLIYVYTHMNLKVHQLHGFSGYGSSQGGNERWQLMSKLFPDLNPNSYDNLSSMKLDLDVLTK